MALSNWKLVKRFRCNNLLKTTMLSILSGPHCTSYPTICGKWLSWFISTQVQATWHADVDVLRHHLYRGCNLHQSWKRTFCQNRHVQCRPVDIYSGSRWMYWAGYFCVFSRHVPSLSSRAWFSSIFSVFDVDLVRVFVRHVCQAFPRPRRYSARVTGKEERDSHHGWDMMMAFPGCCAGFCK